MIMTWSEMQAVVDAGPHMILYGPPGTGKTRMATTPSSYSITLTQETPAAELRGHFVPKGQEFVWHDGPALRAWRQGVRLVLNEIDQASGDALTFLHAVLDDPEVARLSLPTGETVRPSPGFQCIATTNVLNLATALSPALLDRFAVRILCDEYHPQALQGVRTESLRNAVVSTMEDPADRQITLRQALALERINDEKGVSPELTCRAIFGSRATDIVNSLKLGIAAEKINA